MDALDYRQLFESAPGLYCVLNRDFRTVAASDAYLRATMTTREEIVGKSLFDVFPAGPDDPEGKGPAAIRAVFERALAEGKPQALSLLRYDVRRPVAEGGAFQRRYWTAVITPLRGSDGEVQHLLCSVEEVTDRSRDARLGKLMSVDAVGVVFFDPAGTLISANDTFLRWSGYTREEVAEGRLTWRLLTPPEHHGASLDALEQLGATGRLGPYEKEYLTKSGERRWLLFVGARLDDGTVMEYVIDVSDRKAAERAKRESDERYRTLFDSIDAGFCVIEMIYRDGRAVDYRFLEVNHRQVTQLARLVDDLLDVSRIRFGKVQLKRAPIDLREVARDALATSDPVLAAAHHRLSMELGHEPVWVDADRVRLAQVISNLLNNAARYTPAGGHIRLEIAGGETEAGIAVEDNGIGIDAAFLERVFEPFAQLEAREAVASGGIGIGLALAKALMELHGGRISAQSAGPGKGSRFVACLPRASAPKPAAAAGKEAKGAARRLLLVDDNVDAASTQAALLRILGHEVEVAYDGEAALEKAREFRPEIVLLDLGMPGMDGFEVARRLRASKEGRRVKLVAQTGWGQEEDRRRTREAGFDAHLAKPVDIASLQRLL